jgi:phospholipid/cholesterol/gamma-HCH transport system substrate-binding protein
MDENILKFRVGIFVVIAMCILGILIFLNSEGWVPQYTIYIKPTSAPGVTEGTPIRKNGILIGRVKDVTSEDDYVLLELAINDKENIYANEHCSIGSESILGDAMIEILTLPVSQRGEQVGPGHVMEYVDLKVNAMEMMGDLTPKLAETLDAIHTASIGVNETADGFKSLTSTIQSAFQDDGSEFKAMVRDFRGMTVNAQSALARIDVFFENANNIIDDPELNWQLKQALAELPFIMQNIAVATQNAGDIVLKFGDIPDGVNENLDNMKVFTESLKNQGPEVLEQINMSLKNVDELVDQVKGFTGSLDKLKNSEGTLGKLINDPELYNSLLETAEKIQKEVIKIEPTINDIRMFTDAIARDPGVLGIRGALDRRPGKTGYKGSAGRDGGLFK